MITKFQQYPTSLTLVLSLFPRLRTLDRTATALVSLRCLPLLATLFVSHEGLVGDPSPPLTGLWNPPRSNAIRPDQVRRERMVPMVCIEFDGMFRSGCERGRRLEGLQWSMRSSYGYGCRRDERSHRLRRAMARRLPQQEHHPCGDRRHPSRPGG